MVWALFPVDPLPGEESYYLFSKGTYKVGRKGCDIIVNKDKGVSRVHAEIAIDAMISIDDVNYNSSKIRIKDCSKYGTFIKKPLGSKEKVHEFPNKEMALGDADLVSFGTGNATYRFNFIRLVFFLNGLEPARSKELQQKISSIGASISKKWSPKCTHILLDGNAPVNADVVDAIVSKQHFVNYKWIELLAEKRIGTEIPSCTSNVYDPTLVLHGVSVKVVDPESRENCLRGYTFLLESSDKYKVKGKLQTLLEAFGAKVGLVEEYIPHSQGLEDEENNNVVHITAAGEGDGSERPSNIGSIPKVSEINLICSTLSGRLDPAVLVSPPVLVTSSCSTDETVVADSEPELEITSVITSSIHKLKSVDDEKVNISVQHDNKPDMNVHSINPTKFGDHENTTPKDDQVIQSYNRNAGMSTLEHKIDAAENGISDIIFSQDLIIRDTNLLSSVPSPMENQVLNFKQFRKTATQSGNSFYNLVPFSKQPFEGYEYDDEGVAKALKEEKKRKESEAAADDLFKFNYMKEKPKGTGGLRQGRIPRR